MSTRFGVAELHTPFIWSVEGVSEESRKIREMLASISSQQRRLASLAWKDSLVEEISQIYRTCSEVGWDGYEAEPISKESVVQAAQLLQLLPNGVRSPSVVPVPGGDISFQWHGEEHKDFTLGVSGQSLVYAGIFGGSSKAYGEERFSPVLPRTVVEILTGYFSEA